MSYFRVPGPTRDHVLGASDTAGGTDRLAGPVGRGERKALWVTDLLAAASQVRLRPPIGKSVFYHGENGAAAARELVARDASYVRIDELLQRTFAGRALFEALKGRKWAQQEEVWWELSRRLAKESSGDVRVFGDGDYASGGPSNLDPTLDPQGVERFRSRHGAKRRSKPGKEPRLADSVFEKMELPELDNNRLVETIYYNGEALD